MDYEWKVTIADAAGATDTFRIVNARETLTATDTAIVDLMSQLLNQTGYDLIKVNGVTDPVDCKIELITSQTVLVAQSSVNN